ncbi:hypothetical protein GYMLUDRAFT_994125, partial [Collybiopsis luxurians FD-317 M1]
YCSKQCQEAHWPTHKKDCKHPYNRSDWKPTWVAQNRSPAFVGEDLSPQVHFGAHHAPEYLWGNTPAADCLQLEHNEGVAQSIDKDLNLCFAASGDIRNMIKTVNGLPEDYRGRCKIILNDRSPLVSTRNILILYALLRDGPTIECAAETAVHLMYSSALCPRNSSELRHCVQNLYGDLMYLPDSPAFRSIIAIRGRGTLSMQQYICALVAQTLPMLRATHSVQETRKAMHSVMLCPERVDYRDRYLFGLEPRDRLSFLRFRESGILLPYGEDLGKLLFSAAGKWFSMDSANPLFSWDLGEVVKTGQAHGLDRADVYGCLFFHVKAQFMKFASRFERFQIDIHVSQFDASAASELLQKGELYPSLFNKDTKFDRIETSNIADFLGIPRVLGDWSPLINRGNRHASILVYLMNWFLRQPGASTMDPVGVKKTLIPMKKICSVLVRLVSALQTIALSADRCNPDTILIYSHLDSFLDNHAQLQEFLESDGANGAIELHRLRLKARNQVNPRRFGIALGDCPDALPSMTKSEFYNAYILGGCDAGVRFLEFTP